MTVTCLYITRCGEGWDTRKPTMYHAGYMEEYRQPTDMNSYDVGFRYDSVFKEPLLFLYNCWNWQETVKMHLNKLGECNYKIYFKNNTTSRCEVLIFISNRADMNMTHLTNHMIIEPDNPYFIGKPDSLGKCYTFVEDYMGDGKISLNSHVTVIVYPEKDNVCWRYKFPFERGNMSFTYKFRLAKCVEFKPKGYFSLCK